MFVFLITKHAKICGVCCFCHDLNLLIHNYLKTSVYLKNPKQSSRQREHWTLIRIAGYYLLWQILLAAESILLHSVVSSLPQADCNRNKDMHIKNDIFPNQAIFLIDLKYIQNYSLFKKFLNRFETLIGILRMISMCTNIRSLYN